MKVFEFLENPKFWTMVKGGLAVVFAFGFFSIGKVVYVEFSDSFAMKEFREYGVYGTYKKHFFWFADQLGHLAHLEDENEYLLGRVAMLEKQNAVLETREAEVQMVAEMKKLGTTLKNTSGSELATALQTIHYTVPPRLTNAELHTLALGYFRSKDWQKAVVIFEHLQTLKDTDLYKAPNIDLMKGICWFHLKNYKLALNNVLRAKKEAAVVEVEHRHAILWEAVIHRAESRMGLAQKDLLQFLESYPHSEEEEWINRKRQPAALHEPSKEKSHE